MKNHCLVSIILFLFTALVTHPCFAGRIETDKQRWKPFYLDVNPSLEVTQWNVPFKTGDRTDLKTIRTISTFGAPRQFMKENTKRP